ncbi:hypothetical protein RO3G_14619 [Rhizopus delemar RA 99-880]|uniref:Uncharacterized protein n=1 Tax=Rhizopus delemar (strain RA 99-880 / ATCC MYA-4621 / FGSC 9543 / NRRL 43880) TaxID=246409 RepID=I1CN78_RHIO9|nr:hypothetical protein RO3G_14619 [Rhizopus delemar RA 99-880]|eukprot:EIE89908.1 hypothetical protein RO3G_14619 [Rhizopus delemar RA 99-880]
MSQIFILSLDLFRVSPSKSSSSNTFDIITLNDNLPVYHALKIILTKHTSN